LDCFTLEDETDRLSRNVGNYHSKLRKILKERRPQRWFITLIYAVPGQSEDSMENKFDVDSITGVS